MLLKKTPDALRTKADALEKKERLKNKTTKQKEARLYTVSHMIMGGIMIMFFVGVGLGTYVTIFRQADVNITLDYIMQLAKIVSLGYFIKAFGENIARIAFSAIFGSKFLDTDTGTSNKG